MSNPPAAPVPSTADQIQQLQQQLADLQAALLAKPPLPLQPSLSPPPSPSFPPPATILNDSVMLILIITLAVVVVLILLLIMGFVMLSPSAKPLRNAIPFSDLFSRLDDEREAAPAVAGMAPAEEQTQKSDNGDDGFANDVEAGGGSRRGMDEAERERVRERIKAATVSEAGRLEADAESPDAAAAAEAAVAAAGAPEAALLAALTRGASAVEVRALLLRGANPNAAFLNRSALAVAARMCGPAVIKVMLDAGAAIDGKDDRGWTPLMHAIDAHSEQYSREAVLTVLIDAGAAVDVWGNDLKGPLDLLEQRSQSQQRGLTRMTSAQRV